LSSIRRRVLTHTGLEATVHAILLEFQYSLQYQLELIFPFYASGPIRPRYGFGIPALKAWEQSWNNKNSLLRVFNILYSLVLPVIT